MAAFTNTDGSIDYSSAYRIAFDFHRGHSPPTDNPAYWRRVTDDLQAIAAANTGNDFLYSLLDAIFDELEREAGRRRG